MGARLYLLPVQTRVPLKFGPETLTSVTCARVALTVEDREGRRATGWGETPLSVQWGWPSTLTYKERYSRLLAFSSSLTAAWAVFDSEGHPLEIGRDFLSARLPTLLADANADAEEPIPWLAGLICCSPFDQALHDAFGILHGTPTFETYGAQYLQYDLSHFFQSGRAEAAGFFDRYPPDFFTPAQDRLRAWHLVGGLDALDESDLTGEEPNDGYPVTLSDWIRRDGLTCLKIKLRGNDADWDYSRIVRVGCLAMNESPPGLGRGMAGAALSVDFNCTVTDPQYVIDCLDRLQREEPVIYRHILYVEQPFPYDLEKHDIDVHEVAKRKPLFMDESAHDWRHIKLGLERGWNGVALKTCKTQTGAILSLCWAKAHGMSLMVQDLTNPMLAQIPHVQLAAHAGTIMGVETNAMQFYPDASRPEAAVHPGLYTRRNGSIDLHSIRGPGFGYRLDEMDRTLPEPSVVAGEG